MEENSLGVQSTDSRRLERAVRQYEIRFRHPGLAKFEIGTPRKWRHHVNDDGWWTSEAAGKPGCYAIYDSALNLLYVGKASLTVTVGSRLADHERNKSGRFSDAAFIQIITVRYPFEAPSLEEYLILDLLPSLNIKGTTKKPTPDELVHTV